MQTIKRMSIIIPSLLEQQKIADFLSAVDKRLHLLKDKKTKLEEYKRGVMQRIFSQELRFTRTDGSAYPDWEEKRLGEINIILSDGNYGELYPKSSEMLEQGIPFIRANNIKDQKIVWDDMKFISEKQHMILTSGHLEEEDVLITTRGDIGNVALTSREFHGANINAQICLIRIKNKEKVNAKFLLQFLQIFNSRKQLKQLETGSALKQLPKGNLLQLIINLPHIDEQRQIADFLSAIDDKISLLSKQIQSTEQYKKGLLQQMFV